MKEEPNHKGHPVAMLNLITDHSAPLFILLIDFSTVSTVPFCKRHLIGIVAINILYLITNLTWEITTGKPVYGDVLNWHTLRGILTILGCVFFTIAIFFLFLVLSKWKFNRLGHEHMVLIQEGKLTREIQKDSHFITNDT